MLCASAHEETTRFGGGTGASIGSSTRGSGGTVTADEVAAADAFAAADDPAGDCAKPAWEDAKSKTAASDASIRASPALFQA
jgi:hypothetical protein